VTVTAEVDARMGDRTEIIRINASRELILKINEGVLADSSGVKIMITGVYRLHDEHGDSMDVSD
jgi:hypothetical protein